MAYLERMCPFEFLPLIKISESDPNGFEYNGYYYICPEIWCPESRKIISEN